MNRKTTALSAENEQLLQEIVQLRKEIQLLQHDVQYLEKIAREKYGMLKSNEEVYNVNPIAPDPAEPQVTPEGEIEGDVP
ncbi:FtsB family cell division protein [Candidatus Electronema sp. JM]|uniref:FtsB family cell division protein n=1 Tax=Candidatus Electronema sp. JM TaxID=3401571 RepID=UPI003AA98C25